jgi:hypothetical protein
MFEELIFRRSIIPHHLICFLSISIMIFWEAFDIDCRDICQIVGTPDDLVLLCAAALAKTDTTGCLLYQNIPWLTPEQNQLISQSLICLLVYLEALGIKGPGTLREELYILCEGSYSNINDIAHLTSALIFYLDELSQAFLKRRTCAINPSGYPLSIAFTSKAESEDASSN